VTPLTAGTLATLHPEVAVPGYDRERVTAGIVHLGVGGFHRAHQAMYVDRLLTEGLGEEWGICGVGVLPGDARMRDALRDQDHLYTLVVKHADGRLEPRVIGSVVDFLLAPDDPGAVLDRLAAPGTRIVSLTVTEGGYHVHPVTGELDPSGLAQDLAPGSHPTTAFGFVLEGLARRRAAGLPPYTVMSCDNIRGNGDVARRMLVAFARLKDPALADWVDENVAFPSSMVDRITPVTTAADRALLAERFELDDAWPVVCEPWAQWVLEDAFGNGRPPWEKAGVQVVPDVEPYELMKLRLLNGSHQAMAYLGHLMGFRYAHDAAGDPLLQGVLRAFMAEVAPTVPPVPGVDLAGYQAALLQRFANPAIADTVARLCAFSSDRIPPWLVPVIRERLAAGASVDRLALVVASWARYAEGTDEAGASIDVVDRRRAAVTAAAREGAFLEQRELFGDLAEQPAFASAFQAHLESLRTVGARATLQR